MSPSEDDREALFWAVVIWACVSIAVVAVILAHKAVDVT